MRHAMYPLLAGLLVGGAGSPLAAQTLHVNHRWDECAIVLDPSLTADAWRQFVAELGVVTYFRPMTSARPMGAKRFEVAVVQWATRIDDADAAWNDTFSHPDSTHWLFDGDALPIPGLMVRAGVSDRIDVGAYVTRNFRANYGIAGAQLQYNLLRGDAGSFAAAARVSASGLFGPEDVSAGVLGADLVVSRDISFISPYVGVSGFVSRGSERTQKVDLPDETVAGAQGTVGVAVNIRALRLGAEYTVARVPGYALKIAVGR